jgi:hypothetical protein
MRPSVSDAEARREKDEHRRWLRLAELLLAAADRDDQDDDKSAEGDRPTP